MNKEIEQAAKKYAIEEVTYRAKVATTDELFVDPVNALKDAFIAGASSQSTVLGDILERLEKENPSSQPVEGKEDGWIETENQKPVWYEPVWAEFENGNHAAVWLAENEQGLIWTVTGTDVVVDAPVKWQPLPNPPQSSIKEKKNE